MSLHKGIYKAKDRRRLEHFAEYENGEPVEIQNSQENKNPCNLKQKIQLQWILHVRCLREPVDLNTYIKETLRWRQFNAEIMDLASLNLNVKQEKL